MNAMWPARAAGLYGVCVNGGAFGLFYYDKQQAINQGPRIPERTLCLTALAGGWIGGLCAMNVFRHKTVKSSFQAKFWLSVAANVAAVAAIAHPATRGSIFNAFRHSRAGLSPPARRFRRYGRGRR
ncbi:hypothetical protein FVE85_0896 [Porphyridium purpureum]|uniref:DUF1294 domain-containing protein n=1 Tax=Porphyridium purpureum TaxID=35688 RepID=A0A5J4Z3G6_PORPP|nr:hypothetical protein FVE85_0896 [Porphyridium purpureum]|eukprot:POR0061..scf208_2